MKEFIIKPIGSIHNERIEIKDDYWGNVVSVLTIGEEFEEECLAQIESFSHIEVIYYFDRVDDSKIQYNSRHPRNNESFPKVGIFAQRGKNRPNKLGATIVKLLKREGKSLYVVGLDAIDGTPIVDIKPVFKEFLPSEEVKQPSWSTELMEDYWK